MNQRYRNGEPSDEAMIYQGLVKSYSNKPGEHTVTCTGGVSKIMSDYVGMENA